MNSVLLQSARKYPDSVAMSMKIGYRTRSFTYAQTFDLARKFALFLTQKNIHQGDNILLMATNSPYWVLAYWGTILNSSVIVPLNVQMVSSTVRSIIQQTEAKIIIATRRQEFSSDALGSCEVVYLEDFEELVKNFNVEDFIQKNVCEDDIAQIMYTSGTTGDPKGVMMTHKNLSAVLGELARIIQLKPQNDTLVSVLPLSHIFEQIIGMVFPFSLGIHVVYPHARSALVQLMRENKVSKIVAVPEFLHLFMARMKHEFEEKKLDSLLNFLRSISRAINLKIFSRFLFWPVLRKLGGRLNTVASGGAPLDPALEQEWEDFGVVVLQGYGMTEASPLITTNAFKERKVGSVGKPILLVDLKIADDGEILVKGENIFKGYYKNPALTAAAFTEDGWFKTGDVGVLDKDGFLFLKGRKKYMILTAGGQNVFPEDIENVLNQQEGVIDSCVYGDEIAPGVTEIVAVCLLKEGAPSLDAIIARANEQLASYQHINNWHDWLEQDFPRSAVRKIKKEDVKKVIKQRSVTEDKQQVHVAVSTLQRIVSQVTGMPIEAVTDNALLVKDLKLDSLTRIELVARIEEDLGRSIQESLITQKTTYADLNKLMADASSHVKKRTLSTWPRSKFVQLIRPFFQELFIFVVRPRLTLKVTGLENIKSMTGPFLFMPNHLTLFDSLALIWALPLKFRSSISFAAGEDVLYERYKHFAGLIELSFNSFPLPRKESGDIQFGLSNIGQMLDSGYSVVIFPEGKMSESGQLQPLKDGAGLIAITMGVPVVPVKLKNVRELIGYNKMYPHTSGQIEVVFGKPLCIDPKTSIEEAKRIIKEALEAL